MTLTILILLGIGGALFWGFSSLIAQSEYLNGGAQNMADALIALALIAAMWLLFRGAAIFVIGLFADSIIEDVESRHYPAAAVTAVSVSYRRSLGLALRSVGRFLGVNILALPFYFLFIPTAIGVPILALLVNAWLLGHDLEAMVRQRQPLLPALSSPDRWGLGILSAASIAIPIVNFLAPLLSAAMAAHLFYLRHEAKL